MTGFPGAHAGRVAVVTGAAEGLGQAYALRLAEDGAAVVAADIKDAAATAARIVDSGGDAFAVHCDVSDESSVAELLAAAQTRYQRCDILVNNAGISPNVAWDDLTFEQWRRVMSVNLDSMFLTCKAFVPGMRDRGFGRVVNVSSNTFGLVISGFAHYMASKGGVIGLTRALATDLGEHGVTVNAVLPGLTATESVRAAWAHTTFLEDMAQQQAVKRSGLPDDLAGVVSFLASEDARWLTGQSVVVDGGLIRH